ncbi:MAG: helix-turn-helix domain-containing protein [Lachnospiraceae bacterium]|nr:helix-turn-helix domain-containing protein [Lachnospiraceae bacterium]MCH4070130.1 helix-turn-helix domain-containing protein [Lachnospiraceae bacterium]MCH4108518.1 helix-turn-helix domain-containing protein [Lachnospiraceae bacterium]MCI1302467.1 helix-turn-helix domain-containing protein [Lachnospiraceae bacterium]MCI1331640.1 helix-turn-helix domain-containing protein [Lachnospiraceae bacterium]
MRVQHAISLLLTTDMKTYEIASEVGFSDSRSFSDAFVRKYGETPSVYRKRIRASQGDENGSY